MSKSPGIHTGSVSITGAALFVFISTYSIRPSKTLVILLTNNRTSVSLLFCLCILNLLLEIKDSCCWALRFYHQCLSSNFPNIAKLSFLTCPSGHMISLLHILLWFLEPDPNFSWMIPKSHYPLYILLPYQGRQHAAERIVTGGPVRQWGPSPWKVI